jgi:hypothetical protein
MNHEQFPHKQLEIFEDTGQPPGWQKIVRPDGRVVWNPNSALREEQEVLCEQIDFVASVLITNHNFLPYAYGGRKERNVMDNALVHAGNRYFFQVDFADAYGQVDLAVLGAKLADLGRGMSDLPKTPNQAEKLLVETCQPPEGDGLAQGGLASPILFNLYCAHLDDELAAYCQAQGISYSRYLDDLTFSSPDSGYPTFDRIGKAKRRAIREIIDRHGLVLNEAKTRVKDIDTAPVIVTGLQINQAGEGKVRLTNRYVRQARRDLRELIMTYQDPKDLLQFAAGLNGLLHASLDRNRKMADDERALYVEVQDVLMAYGRGPRF